MRQFSDEFSIVYGMNIASWSWYGTGTISCYWKRLIFNSSRFKKSDQMSHNLKDLFHLLTIILPTVLYNAIYGRQVLKPGVLVSIPTEDEPPTTARKHYPNSIKKQIPKQL